MADATWERFTRRVSRLYEQKRHTPDEGARLGPTFGGGLGGPVVD